jgi:hypothetical protein
MSVRIRVSVTCPTLPPIVSLGIDNAITCVDAPACLLLVSVGLRMIYASGRVASKCRVYFQIPSQDTRRPRCRLTDFVVRLEDDVLPPMVLRFADPAAGTRR